MAKPRSSSSKRDREFKKRERDQMKRNKAALKRERRENNKSAPSPLSGDVVLGAEADAQPSDGQDAPPSLPEDSESASDADAGIESGTG